MRSQRRSLARDALLAVGLTIVLLATAFPATAQRLIPGERPADRPLELPPLEAEQAERPAPILPPYSIPEAPDRSGMAGGLRFVLREIRIEGNDVLPDAVFAGILDDYLARPIDWADLLQLRDRITLTYVDRGYATSGATIPEQSLGDGVLVLQVIEGRIEAIEVSTDGRFRPSTLKQRLAPVRDGPVDVRVLERRLRQLQRDPRIARVDAALEPTERRGASILRLVVQETSPWQLELEADNARNPAIGEWGGRLRFGFDNAIGIGDAVSFDAGVSEGLRQLEGRVSLPVSPWQTRLSLGFRWSSARIVEDPLADAFRFATRSRSFMLELEQPLAVIAGGDLVTSLRGELRRSKSTLDSDGFSFVDGPRNGVSRISVLRWGLSWTRRGRVSAFAVRSLASVGLDAFDATIRSAGVADGQFLAWLLQVQSARRLPWYDIELVGRGELQLANGTLLPMEQMAIGGRYSVRGYRENARVGDNGFSGSVEARIPLYSRVEPALRWDFVPFVDVGHTWNDARRTGPDHTLASVGVGTRLAWDRHAELELFWGHSIEDVDRIGADALQDHGVHLRFTTRWRGGP